MDRTAPQRGLGTSRSNLAGLRSLERGLIRIRWFGVVFAIFQVWQSSIHDPLPPGYVTVGGYAMVAVLLAGNMIISMTVRRGSSATTLRRLGLAAFLFDATIIFGFAFLYSYERNDVTWVLAYILPLEGALRYQLRGALASIVMAFTAELGREVYRVSLFPGEEYFISSVTFRVGVLAIIALVAGFMARNMAERAVAAERYAQSAEEDAKRESETAARLRDIDEMKNSFLEAVSHELRTPLTALLGGALVLERPDLDLHLEERRRMAGRLAVNARKLDRLLRDLLDLDRLTRGIMEARRRDTNLGDVVERVLAEADLAGREIEVDGTAVTALVDPPKVERILENLIINASRHTPPESSVAIRVERRRNGVVLIVEDSGRGVPDDLKQTLFDPFSRGDTPSHSPGTGVGLAIVQRFAELHGGRAWVEDRPGGGASFRVFLATPEPPEPIAESIPAVTGAAADGPHTA